MALRLAAKIYCLYVGAHKIFLFFVSVVVSHSSRPPSDLNHLKFIVAVTTLTLNFSVCDGSASISRIRLLMTEVLLGSGPPILKVLLQRIRVQLLVY